MANLLGLPIYEQQMSIMHVRAFKQWFTRPEAVFSGTLALVGARSTFHIMQRRRKDDRYRDNSQSIPKWAGVSFDHVRIGLIARENPARRGDSTRESAAPPMYLV